RIDRRRQRYRVRATEPSGALPPADAVGLRPRPALARTRLSLRVVGADRSRRSHQTTRNRRRARPPANFPSAPTRDAAPSRTRSQARARERSPTNSPRSDAILERGVGKPSGSVFGKDQYSDDLLHGGRASLAPSARPPSP